MRDGNQYPLPAKQYRWYALFWSALMVGSLIVGLGQTLWRAGGSLTWREVVVSLLLLAQIGVYVAVVFSAREFPPPRRLLILYFVGNYVIWIVEHLLVPEVWWIVFAYIGQMFGLLPTKTAFLMMFLPSFFLMGKSVNWSLSDVDAAQFWAGLAQWGSVVVLFLYIGHLAQTSQERGRLIAELEAAKKELEDAQQREAELAVLRERERLARDLHDSLGHALVALSVQLEAIQRLYRVDPERASAQVDEVKALTRSSMDALRRSVAGLRAPGLGDRALRSALLALCTDFCERTGIEAQCEVDAEADALRPVLAESLWRVTQEALTNVEKHARAHRVAVSLRREQQSVVLCVTDDGVGLPEGAASSPNHFGLRGMRERVEGLGGTLDLRGDGTGTCVRASLPVVGSTAETF
jgi:signal transduction histidine kinase